MNSNHIYDKMLLQRDGYLVCPCCRQNTRVLRIRDDTTARNLQVYCRRCKREFVIDIAKGECYFSHGQ